ncbi:ATP-binding protein [Thioalbus denitrificans]|uniref:histidine kinase n=1 Tax=Thioalbus denitrificans TaxID=547122 RepID=A0A369BX34_9GAMM|nr:ATP-binding protein [Thioalbus denitrificans]RCX24977.1 signal transduction histidine kinase [Thioalbus denitrificans]
MGVFTGLLHNATLLISLAMLHSLVLSRLPVDTPTRRLVSGLLFGTAAVLGMTQSVQLLPGVVFDGRSVVLSMAGLFGGPTVAAITTVMSVAYRILLGGAGMSVGTGVIITSAAIGVLGHILRSRGRLELGPASLFLIGIIVHLGVLAWMLALPEPIRWQVLKAISLPMMLTFPLATLLFGALLLLVENSNRSIAALRDAHENLERQVEERTAELARANEHLLELDRLKSLFIASMSHELRTPLNSIIGFTGMMLQEIPGPINARQRDYLERVSGSGRHLLGLISDVIDIAKIEAGKAQPYVERFDLGDLVVEAAEQIRPEAERKGLELTIDAPGDVVIASDRRRLMQCLLNYLGNAMKYTQHGGITIRAQAPAEGGEIEIAVTDSGVGIDPGDQPRLFQQFSRVDSEITRRTHGTGLGLYLTRKLATDVLGGRVSVESRPGEGSTFRLHLPRELKT